MSRDERILQRKLSCQIRRIDGFIESVDSIIEADETIRLEIMGEELKEIKEKIEKLYDELFSLDEVDIDKESEAYDGSMNKIGSLRVKIENERKLKDKLADIKPNGSQANIKLPQFDLPIYDGDLGNWINFKELFLTTIDAHPGLTNIQKLQYLNSAVKGEAARLIRGFPLLSENYGQAWSTLLSRYDNPRELAYAQVSKIFSLRAIKNPSAKCLHEFMDVCNEAIRNLETLELKRNQLVDVILVHFLQQKLSENLRLDWELSVNNTLPSYDKFIAFISRHARSMSCAVKECSKREETTGSRFPKCQSYGMLIEKSDTCILCKSKHHPLYMCNLFCKMPLKEKLNVVKGHKLCFNCLRKGHFSWNCRLNQRCKVCKGKHHTMIHYDKPSTEGASAQVENTTPKEHESAINLTNTQQANCNDSHVLLATARIKIKNGLGKLCTCRALLDSGSQVTMITKGCCERLGLVQRKSDRMIIGVGNTPVQHSSSTVSVTFCPLNNSEEFSVEAVVTGVLTSEIPNFRLKDPNWPTLKSLKLADPEFYIQAPIDMILGADIYTELMLNGSISLGEGLPMAINTRLGWVLLGKLMGTSESNTEVCNLSLQSEPELEFVMKRFWETESVPSPDLCTQDEDCERLFSNNHGRDSHGRYWVKLPFRQHRPLLGESREKALRRFLSLEGKLCKNVKLYDQYRGFMKEYEHLNHMERVPIAEVKRELCRCYYMPHHPEDADYQRILWKPSPEEPVVDYRLLTVTYGTTSASFLAMRTLQQLAEDEGQNYPEASRVTLNDFYVDDLLTGAQTIAEAKELIDQLKDLMKKGGFHLRKWNSNCQEIVSHVEEMNEEKKINLEKGAISKILGIVWDHVQDTFRVNITLPEEVVTKRDLLSNIARIFDPIGFLSPTTVAMANLQRQTAVKEVEDLEGLPVYHRAILKENGEWPEVTKAIQCSYPKVFVGDGTHLYLLIEDVESLDGPNVRSVLYQYHIPHKKWIWRKVNGFAPIVISKSIVYASHDKRVYFVGGRIHSRGNKVTCTDNIVRVKLKEGRASVLVKSRKSPLTDLLVLAMTFAPSAFLFMLAETRDHSTYKDWVRAVFVHAGKESKYLWKLNLKSKQWTELPTYVKYRDSQYTAVALDLVFILGPADKEHETAEKYLSFFKTRRMADQPVSSAELKKLRTPVRARFTKAFNELETEIKKKEVKKADVEKILRRLQTHHEKLLILNMRMEEALLRESASEDIFTAEYESVCEYEDNFSNIMTDYEALAEEDDVSTSTISGTAAMNYRLPKLEFKKFGGEPREWITFWSQFSTIDRDPQMPPETKFQYLFQATAENSEAREAVESFPPSADNYPKVIEYIKSRFGEDEMLVEIYVRDLLQNVLQNVRAEGKMSVVKLYDRLETQLRAFETLGVARDKFAAMLYPLVESALPEDTLRVWERSQYTVSGRGVQDKLTQLMTFLKTEVKGESRVNMAKAAFKIDNNQDAKDDRSNRKSLSKKNTGSKMPTATDLANTTQIANTTRMRNNCIFCGNGHPSQECYSGQRMHLPEKKDKAKWKNVCFWCLLPGHGFKKCRIKPRCPVCGGKHCPIMCPTLEAQKTSHLQKAELKVSRESPATKQETANQFTSKTLNNATVGGVYLQTLIVKISGPKGKHNVRVLLDCGSQRSYISKRMVDALGLKRVQQVTLTHNLFGGGEIRQKKHNVYKVNLSSLNNEYMDDLKFLDQEVICGHISQVQDHTILNELKARRINLTDICQGEEISIHMLIGSDLLSRILTGRMQIFQNGVVATETKLGWTVMGPAIGKDMEDSCLIVTSFHSNSFEVQDLWKLDVLGIMDAAETKSKKDLIEASNTHFKETIQVREEDREFLRFLWWKKDQKTLKFYRHYRVVFGLTSSPFLLAATIKYHLSLPQFQDNRCAELLARSFYVDNCILSLSSTHDVKIFIKESSDIMMQAKFELRDWMWNEPGITEQDPASILGMKWHLQTDTIAINVQSLKNIDEEKSITKRSILSACHRIFDPIQFTCPATIKIKKMVQDAWKENKSWDEPLNEDRRVEFIKWRKQALELDQIKIPRWILPIKGRTTLHVFCDASAIAYATVIFMRIENASVIVVRFVEARNRLATIKRITIPRLELFACLIGARLLVHVLENLEESPEKIQCWIDSSPALYWIQQQENWAQFVSNRVKEITTLTKREDWNHVAGEHNPADLPSRGESPSKFTKSGWWEGPKWLQEKKEDWPVSKVQYDLEAIEEERRKTVVAGFVAKKPEENPWYLNLYEGKREVTLTQILRVIAWMLRFKPSEYKGDIIIQEELDSAEKSLVKIIQSESIARQLVRHVIHKCPRCRRFETKRVDVPEASLPQHRVRDVVVFEVTGIDLGGPLYLEDGQKVWLVIFTCGVYRAVHLELVTSLSTEALVGAVEKFVARRGCPAVIYPDNGTNLVRLRNELYRVNFGVKWKLNPPAAPWWGEMFLREPRAEGEIDLNEFRCNFGKSYEKRKRLLKEFRKRFRSEYLGLLVHHDNRKKQRQLKVGDIVLVEVENRKQINWPMGKITKVFPGTDNVRRLVEVKTMSGFMKRAVQRLFPLEVPSEDVEQGDGELKPAEDEIVREKTSGVESASVQEKTTPLK
ncbi:hypothetical protein LAZ67_X003999, partial [Cordylochernes scorpioides]